jgi:PAS domain S-box-containing protein
MQTGVVSKQVLISESFFSIIVPVEDNIITKLATPMVDTAGDESRYSLRFLLELHRKAITLPEKELYEYFLDYAVKATKSKIGFFHFVSEDQKETKLTAWNKEALKTCSANYQDHYPIEQAGNWADCIRFKHPIIYNHFKESPNQKGIPEGHVSVKRILSFPILDNGKVRAIFGVGNKARLYRKEDIRKLELVARELNNIIQQRQVENELRESEEKYHSLFANMLDGFAYHKIVTDVDEKPVDYVFLEVNDAFEKATGLRRENIVGKKVTQVLPGIEKDPADWIGVYGRVALTHEPAQFENYAQPLDKWFQVSAYCPEKGYFVTLFDDITDRKKAEEAIIRQASLIDLSPDAIIVRSLEGTITFWSKGAENMYGWTATEAIGQITHALLKTKFPEPLNDIISQVVTSGCWTGELGHKTKDGRDLVVQSWWLAEKDENGEIKGILESNIDATERKKSEEKLRESKVWEATSFYTRTLIETSLDPLVTINAEGKITDVNRATENVTGCSREELIGSDFLNYFTEPEKASAGYKQVFTEGFVKDYPLAIRHKSGKVTDVLYNASVYRNAEGEVQGVFAAARDVTERKKLEQKLKESERLATIGATAGMVGHDIRNPLQAITSDVYLAKTDLASTPESEEKKNVLESLQEIEKNVDYVNKIVADLQDFARPISPKPEEVDLEQAIHSVLARLEIPGNVTARHSIRRDFPKLKVDPAYLQRILTNLANNAIQAMPKGGKLAINAVTKNGKAIISVEDNGEGIPESIRSKLFTPLVTTKSKGQGFGLSVVKRFTEGMGGTVTFESEVGKGTKFILELPL